MTNTAPKWKRRVGWVLSVLPALLMVFSAAMKLSRHPEVAKQLVGTFGYPEHVGFAIGVVELSCVILYLVPQTAMLGAILLTGYLGGAVATHVRISDVFISPIVIGVLVWLGLYLRDARLHALLPLRKPER